MYGERIKKREKGKKMGDVHWQRNEDLYDMKYVVRYLCSVIATVVNPQGRNETDHAEWE
jgi:hypothetical protein